LRPLSQPRPDFLPFPRTLTNELLHGLYIPIRKAAGQLENVSDAMRNRDMSQIVGNVQDFARKQPTAFFGAAVLVGFAAVRFLKSGTSNGAGTVAPTQPNIGGTTAGM